MLKLIVLISFLVNVFCADEIIISKSDNDSSLSQRVEKKITSVVSIDGFLIPMLDLYKEEIEKETPREEIYALMAEKYINTPSFELIYSNLNNLVSLTEKKIEKNDFFFEKYIEDDSFLNRYSFKERLDFKNLIEIKDFLIPDGLMSSYLNLTRASTPPPPKLEWENVTLVFPFLSERSPLQTKSETVWKYLVESTQISQLLSLVPEDDKEMSLLAFSELGDEQLAQILKLVNDRKMSVQEAYDYYVELDERHTSELYRNSTDFYVVAPEDVQGGFGDLVTNIWNARTLKTMNSDLRVKVIIPKSYDAKMRTLYPEYNSLLDEQTIEGMTFVRRPSLESGRRSCYMSFSSRETVIPKDYETRDDHYSPTVIFTEYFEKVMPLGRRDYSGKYIMLTTGPRNLGMYLSDNIPTPPLDKESLFEKYGINDGDEVAFSYSARPVGKSYYEEIYKKAKATPSRIFHVFYKKFKEDEESFPNLGNNTVEKPENVVLHSYKSIPIKETESLIAYSTLPLFVTGDMSVTMAVEYAKPFMYEILVHKRGFIEDLFRILSDYPDFDNNISLNNFANTYNFNETVDASLLFEEKNQKVMIDILMELKKRNSLSAKIVDICQYFSNSKNKEMANQNRDLSRFVAGKKRRKNTKDVVNIYTPVSDQHGFGDLVSNLRMAELYAQEHPEKRVQLIINSPRMYEKLASIIPELDLSKEYQEWNGIHIYGKLMGKKFRYPPGEKALSFSRKLNGSPTLYNDGVTELDALKSIDEGSVIIFDEFSSNNNFAKGVPKSPPKILDSKVTGEDLTNITVFTLGAGPQTMGIYISPIKPTGGMESRELHSKLYEFKENLINGEKLNFSINKHLGVSYASSLKGTLHYIRTLKQMYLKKSEMRLGGTQLVVHWNPSWGDFNKHIDGENIPKGMTIVGYDKIPYELSKGLIKNSNLPIMVTGDVSLSLAVEYSKKFIYETNSWKVRSIKGLMSTYKQKFKGKMDAFKRWKSMAIYSLESGTPNLSEMEAAEILSDELLGKRLQNAMEDSRRELSLVANLDPLTELLEESQEGALLYGNRDYEDLKQKIEMIGAQPYGAVACAL